MKPEKPILHICDFRRGVLNVRLYARIQHLLPDHKYAVLVSQVSVLKNTTATFSGGVSPLPAAIQNLLKVFYSTFENLLILFCVNILSNILSETFRMCHLTKDTSVWACDTFNSIVGTIWIVAVIHCRFSV